MYAVGVTKTIPISLLFLAGTGLIFDILLTNQAVSSILHHIKCEEINEDM